MADKKKSLVEDDVVPNSIPDKDMLIDEQRKRILFLEKEFRSSQDEHQTNVEKLESMARKIVEYNRIEVLKLFQAAIVESSETEELCTNNRKLEIEIIERKQAEQALYESKERLRLAQEVARIGTFDWNIQTGVNVWTPELERMYGLPVGGFPGTYSAWEKLVYPEDRAEASLRISEAIENGGFEGEWRVVWPDSTVHWLYARGWVFKDELGRPLKLLGVNIDITERKRAEEELMDAKMRAELYLDLVGHDISNIHQIMEGQLELAQEIMAEQGKLQGDEKELIDTPLRILIRSNKLIENVRKLQKLETGVCKSERVDIGETLGDVVGMYSSIPDKDASIDYAPVLGCIVEANPLLRDVFANLVDNAIKHSNGSARISIKVDKVVKDGRANYRVAVEDNGPGIPDEKKREIFRRLKSGQTHVRGTGLGLYIVKTLVESFDGVIEVEDRVKGDYTQGARFLVYLPVVKEDNNGD
jgi:PAS domain S-box-containing protein